MSTLTQHMLLAWHAHRAVLSTGEPYESVSPRALRKPNSCTRRRCLRGADAGKVPLNAAFRGTTGQPIRGAFKGSSMRQYRREGFIVFAGNLHIVIRHATHGDLRVVHELSQEGNIGWSLGQLQVKSVHTHNDSQT